LISVVHLHAHTHTRTHTRTHTHTHTQVWERVASKLRTNEDLVVTYNGVPLVTNSGPCTVASLRHAVIR
jgi:hypothetical protein